MTAILFQVREHLGVFVICIEYTCLFWPANVDADCIDQFQQLEEESEVNGLVAAGLNEVLTGCEAYPG